MNKSSTSSAFARRRAIVLAAFLASLVALHLGETDCLANDPPTIEDWEDRLEVYRTEIQSAVVTGKYTATVMVNRETSFDEVEDRINAFEKLVSTDPPDAEANKAFESLIDGFLSDEARRPPIHPTVFVQRGTDASYEVDCGEQLGKLRIGTVEGHDFSYRENFNEVIVGIHRAKVGFRRSSTYRPVPSLESNFNFFLSDGTTIRENPDAFGTYTLDPEHLLPVAFDTPKRIQRHLMYQSHDGILFPKYSVIATFKKGRFSVVNAFLLLDASFNQKVPRAVLTGTYKRKTRVHDRRDPDNLAFGYVTEVGDAIEVADVVQEAKQARRAALAPPETPPASNAYRLAVVVAIVAGVAALVSFFWNRQKSRA